MDKFILTNVMMINNTHPEEYKDLVRKEARIQLAIELVEKIVNDAPTDYIVRIQTTEHKPEPLMEDYTEYRVTARVTPYVGESKMAVTAVYDRHQAKRTELFDTVKEAASSLFWIAEEGVGYPRQIIENGVVVWESVPFENNMKKLAKLAGIKYG